MTTKETAKVAAENKIALASLFQQKIKNRLLFLDGRMPDLILFDAYFINDVRLSVSTINDDGTTFSHTSFPADVICFSSMGIQNGFTPDSRIMGHDLRMDEITDKLKKDYGACIGGQYQDTSKQMPEGLMQSEGEYCLLLMPTKESWFWLILICLAADIGIIILIKEAWLFIRYGKTYFKIK